MDKIKCIVVDDEPFGGFPIRELCSKIPFWSLSLVQENPLEALDFIQNNEADLAF